MTLCKKVWFQENVCYRVLGEMKHEKFRYGSNSHRKKEYKTDVLSVSPLRKANAETSASLSLHGENHLTLINL